MTTIPIETRRDVMSRLAALAESPAGDIPAKLAALYAPDAVWRGAHPLNEMAGLEAIEETVWAPLLHSFPDLERRDVIFVGGSYEGRDYVAQIGHYCGTFRKDWLTIPATGRPIYLRYGEVHQIEGGRIVQSNCLWDILDVMRQAGFWPLAPSLGTEGLWPGPITTDGIVLTETDPAQSATSIAQTLAMHGSLAEHDDRACLTRESLMTMPQKHYWHPKMMWYGPAGIGTTRGLQGFVDYHQLPFRKALQRPQGSFEEVMAARKAHGAGHYIRIGDGPYSVTGGWPSVYAIHNGDNFLGLGPTGREVTMRVMDFYLHHEGLIRENWVPLDIPHVLLQLGVDVFERMQSHFDHRPFA
ncbi:MAG: nuclear transport factor 2 family protein [Pseudomonadota bacterium]|nr:nuclear transport factor 2 family protein [Pseudomonadota bacterium]